MESGLVQRLQVEVDLYYPAPAPRAGEAHLLGVELGSPIRISARQEVFLLCYPKSSGSSIGSAGAAQTPDTWQDYRCDLNFFLESVGDRPANEITFRDIDRFLEPTTRKGLQAVHHQSPVGPSLRCTRSSCRRTTNWPAGVPPPTSPARTPKAAAPGAGAGTAPVLRRDRRPPRPGHLHAHAALRPADRRSRPSAALGPVPGGRRRRAWWRRAKAPASGRCICAPGRGILRAYLAVRPAAVCEYVFLSYQMRGLSTHAIHMAPGALRGSRLDRT